MNTNKYDSFCNYTTAKQRREIVQNAQNNKIKWGFDLSSMQANDWKSILALLGMAKIEAQKRISKHGSISFEWQIPSALISTNCNPITGEFHDEGIGARRDYLSYVTIFGKKNAVLSFVNLFHRYADYIKDEAPLDYI